MLTADSIQKALELKNAAAPTARNAMAPVPGTAHRPPDKKGRPRIGAVLMVLYRGHRGLCILLIKRRDSLQYHPGQISFPGGRREKNEPLMETALRETEEEIGIPSGRLTVLGSLAPVYILPSDFVVHPFVAWHEGPPHMRLDTHEVASVIEAAVDTFFTSGVRGADRQMRGGRPVTVPYFILGSYKVWGATAMMLAELLERLRTAGPGLNVS